MVAFEFVKMAFFSYIYTTYKTSHNYLPISVWACAEYMSLPDETFPKSE